MPWKFIDDNEMLEKLVLELEAEPAIALDTEFHREKTYYPQRGLIQLAWPAGIALVDPVKLDVTPLAGVLERALIIGHALDQDLEVLRLWVGATPRRLFDTQLASAFVGYSTPSLQSLLERRLGVMVTKGDRLSDWSSRPLSESQLNYAASDVEYLIDLYDGLCDDLRAVGRLAWAQEECALVAARQNMEPSVDVAWWRMKDTRSFKGATRKVAQSLVAWRETRARERDLPPRFVLSDLAVSAISQRGPSTEQELKGVRGAQGLKAEIVREILSAISTGKSMSDDDLRLPPSDPVDRNVRPGIALVQAWVAQLGRDLRIDPSVLATRADVVALVQDRTDARLKQGWRGPLVQATVGRLLRGEAALSFDPNGDLVLEERSHVALSVAGGTDA